MKSKQKIWLNIYTTFFSEDIASHSYHVFIVKTLKYSLYKFQVQDILLLIVITKLYIKSPEVIGIVIESLYPLAIIFPSPTSKILVTTILLSVTMS